MAFPVQQWGRILAGSAIEDHDELGSYDHKVPD